MVDREAKEGDASQLVLASDFFKRGEIIPPRRRRGSIVTKNVGPGNWKLFGFLLYAGRR